jgi:protein-disulfide isomerase-like protein with CxxC motif
LYDSFILSKGSEMSLMPRNDGTMEVYDVEALKKCITESRELETVTIFRALRAINQSRWSKGKDFPTFDLIIVLDKSFGLSDDEVASILKSVEGRGDLTKKVRIRK